MAFFSDHYLFMRFLDSIEGEEVGRHDDCRPGGQADRPTAETVLDSTYPSTSIPAATAQSTSLRSNPQTSNACTVYS